VNHHRSWSATPWTCQSTWPKSSWRDRRAFRGIKRAGPEALLSGVVPQEWRSSPREAAWDAGERRGVGRGRAARAEARAAGRCAAPARRRSLGRHRWGRHRRGGQSQDDCDEVCGPHASAGRCGRIMRTRDASAGRAGRCGRGACGRGRCDGVGDGGGTCVPAPVSRASVPVRETCDRVTRRHDAGR
jgi:hypothetical protein